MPILAAEMILSINLKNREDGMDHFMTQTVSE